MKPHISDEQSEVIERSEFLADFVRDNSKESECASILHNYVLKNNIPAHEEEMFVGKFYENLYFDLLDTRFSDSIIDSYKKFIEANEETILLDNLHDIVWSDLVHVMGFGNDSDDFEIAYYYKTMFTCVNEVFSVLPKSKQSFINSFNADIVGDSLPVFIKDSLPLIERVHDLGVITQKQATEIENFGYDSILDFIEEFPHYAARVLAHLVFIDSNEVSEFAATIEWDDKHINLHEMSSILKIFNSKCSRNIEKTYEFADTIISIIENNSVKTLFTEEERDMAFKYFNRSLLNPNN